MAKFVKGKTGNPAGRPKGVPNKVTTDLRTMVTEALTGVGGVEYLKQQAEENPAAFMALIGKSLPKDVSVNGGITVTVITGVPEPDGNR